MRTLQRQASTLSYIDCFWLMGIVLPAVFFMKKTQPGPSRRTELFLKRASARRLH